MNVDTLDWNKMNGLIPATVQDADSGRVLMIGYMSRESLERTLESRRVTFWSRSRNALWTKGETSGNYLDLVSCFADCDNDALLVLAKPNGPTCHLGSESCFADARSSVDFIGRLDRIVQERRQDAPQDSYTAKLFDAGIKRIAQKVGEEGVEVALAATGGDDDEFVGEVGDLLYHVLVLLHSRNLSVAEVSALLESRHAGS